MKSIKYIFISFFVLLSFSMHAQNSLSGKITSDNKPLFGATIYLSDLKTGAATKEDGSYIISNLPKGTYLIEVRLIDYALKTMVVKIDGNTVQDFTLIESENELQEVVVTGNSVAIETQNNPTPIVEVPHSYLEQNPSTNIIEAISKIPGVSGISDGQSISKPVIRGLGYNRVVTVVDGIRQEGQQWGDEFGIEVDPNSVDRIEILKGPGSLAYGSDAISGVINMIPEKPLPEGQMKGDVAYNFQTNNGLHNLTIHLAGTQKGISWSARVSGIMAHAYQNPNDGYVLNSQFNNFAYDGTIGIHRKWGFSQLHYSYFEMRTGIVEGARDSTGAFVKQAMVNGQPDVITATHNDLTSYNMPDVIKQLIKHYKVVWDNSIALGQGRMVARFAWQQNSRQENNDITIPETSNIFYLLNTINYDLRYVSPEINHFNYSLGINGMSQNSVNKGTLLLIPEYDLFDFGAFAIVNKNINRLHLSGGLRYDVRQFHGHDDYIDSNGNQLLSSDPNAIHRFTAYNSNFSGISGSIGATYDVTKNVYLKGNIAQGFRAPNVAESGSNGIHDGTVVYEIGDPSLKAESSMQFDLAVGINSKDVTFEIDLFSNNISNFIHPVHLYTSSGADSLNSSTPGFSGAPVFKYQQDDVSINGGEVVLDIHPSNLKWLDFYTAFSMVNSYLKNQPDSAKYLPFTPPSRLRSEITFNIKKVNNWFTNSYIRFGVMYSFEQKNVYQQSSVYQGLSSYELAASLAPSAAYFLMNAGIGTDINLKKKKICALYFSVNNIADVAYMDYMSRFKYYQANAGANNRVGVYNMGRNFSIKLIVPIKF